MSITQTIAKRREWEQKDQIERSEKKRMSMSLFVITVIQTKIKERLSRNF